MRPGISRPSGDIGQSLVEFLLVNTLIALGLLSIWSGLQKFAASLVHRLLVFISLPIP